MTGTLGNMITVEGLNKRYGKQHVLKDLSFTVPDGQVTGFLGPNGSGKSTTMRCILDLDRPTSGFAGFSGNYSTGKSYSANFGKLDHKANVAGAVLDANWFDPKRSGRGHLQVLAASGGLPNSRVEECLKLVGLDSAANRKVGGYSLGMKQRLALAGAMLGDPQHLILDEPVNGLDPEGVQWMRNIIRRLASEGRAVLVSSHLLSEMQLTADRLVVIGRGEMIGEYSMDEFLAGGKYITVQVHNGSRPLAEALADKGIKSEYIDGGLRVSCGDIEFSDADLRYTIAALALENNILVTELSTQADTLEQRFLAATSDKQEYRMGEVTNA